MTTPRRIDIERIRKLRSAGLTVREIAHEMKCHPSYVGQILRANPPGPLRAHVRATGDGRVIIDTDQPQVVGVAVKRLLLKLGAE